MEINPKFPVALDNTIVSAWRKCRRLMWYEHVLGCGSPVKNEHLHFGACYAKGLETARKAFYAEGRSVEDAIAIGSQAIMTAWGEYIPPQDTVKTLANCIDAFDRYLTIHYPFGRDPFIPYRSGADSPPMIEFSFAIPLPIDHPDTGEPLLYCGRADQVSVMADACGGAPWTAEGVWAQDEKSTKDMGPTWANQWRLAGQFLGYAYALRERGLKVSGALVRGVCLYKRADPKFQDAIIPFDDARIDRWHSDLIMTVREMVEFYRYYASHSSYPPMDWGFSCAAYGGCSFLDMCEVNNPTPFLETTYVERRWNPITREEESSNASPLDYTGVEVPFSHN